MKKRMAVCLAAVFSCANLALGACAGGREKPWSAAPGENLGILENVEFDYDSAFFDDFTDGVGSEDWYIAKQAWGGYANGGVVPENVNFTEDGELVLTGNGAYYTAGEVGGVGQIKDGSRTGGCLISKFLTGPGRYEVKMKVLPRLGACTAFWTYANRPPVDESTFGENENHEIDIELPGGKDQGVISFKNVLNTNYRTAETQFESQDRNVASVYQEEQYVLNDGQWHTYGFDWYSDPGMIVYYLDGRVLSVSTDNIPSLQSRLWLGVWFPNNSGFVGEDGFATDYMYVDYVSYIPFAAQPFEPFSPGDFSFADASEYPSAPVAKREPNKIASGDFEYVLNPAYAAANKGWTMNRSGAGEVGDFARIAAGIGADGSAGATVRDRGFLRQQVTAVYEGFTHRLGFEAIGQGKVFVTYLDAAGSPVREDEIAVDAAAWRSFSYRDTAPAGTYSVQIDVFADTAQTMSVDNFTMYRD